MDVAQLCQGAGKQLYMLAHCHGYIHVVLATSCTPADVLEAFVHARILARMTTQDEECDQVIALTCASAPVADDNDIHDCLVVYHWLD